MPKLRNLTSVDESYASTGPNHTLLRQKVAKPADSLFRCLVDGPAWKEWLGIDVEWTSPEPFGIGTTRTVTRGPVQIDETFLAWDEGSRMCFQFDRATMPMKAFAEDYVIEAHGAHRCELLWHYSFEWDGPLGSTGANAFNAIFKRQGVSSLKKLAALVEGTTRFDQPSAT